MQYHCVQTLNRADGLTLSLMGFAGAAFCLWKYTVHTHKGHTTYKGPINRLLNGRWSIDKPQNLIPCKKSIRQHNSISHFTFTPKVQCTCMSCKAFSMAAICGLSSVRLPQSTASAPSLGRPFSHSFTLLIVSGLGVHTKLITCTCKYLAHVHSVMWV